MAITAGIPTGPAMDIIQAMTIDTRRTGFSKQLIDMTRYTSHLIVFPFQMKISSGMIEFPRLPCSGIMAIVACFTEVTLMNILVFMAIYTAFGGIKVSNPG